jgi:hypothetical protein
MSAVALSLLLLVTPASSPIPGLKPLTAPSYTQHPAENRLGVNANELRLKMFGGWRGEKLTAIGLKPSMPLGPSKLFADRHGHLYADRDGDGVIDTCALHNEATGMISADVNCDGRGDQILADIKP